MSIFFDLSGYNIDLPQLAILTSAPVEAGVFHQDFPRGLARYASPHARQSGAAAFGDGFAAVVAIFGAFSRWHARAGSGDGVLDAIVDLVLHRAVTGPSAGHHPASA